MAWRYILGSKVISPRTKSAHLLVREHEDGPTPPPRSARPPRSRIVSGGPGPVHAPFGPFRPARERRGARKSPAAQEGEVRAAGPDGILLPGSEGGRSPPPPKNFYEKALFVKSRRGGRRVVDVTALCPWRYASIRTVSESTFFGDSVHYEIRLFELKALQSSDRPSRRVDQVHLRSRLARDPKRFLGQQRPWPSAVLGSRAAVPVTSPPPRSCAPSFLFKQPPALGADGRRRADRRALPLPTGGARAPRVSSPPQPSPVSSSSYRPWWLSSVRGA